MQGMSNKMHNQVGTGIKAHKTIPSETKQTKTSQTIDVTLIMKTKGSTESIPYGINTLLGWTLTGPISQKYTQKRVGQSNSTSIALFNLIKRRQDDPEEDLLQLFWTIVFFKGTVFR